MDIPRMCITRVCVCVCVRVFSPARREIYYLTSSAAVYTYNNILQ